MSPKVLLAIGTAILGSMVIWQSVKESNDSPWLKGKPSKPGNYWVCTYDKNGKPYVSFARIREGRCGLEAWFVEDRRGGNEEMERILWYKKEPMPEIPTGQKDYQLWKEEPFGKYGGGVYWTVDSNVRPPNGYDVFAKSPLTVEVVSYKGILYDKLTGKALKNPPTRWWKKQYSIATPSGWKPASKGN